MKTEVVYTRQITQEQVENIRKLCQASEKKTEDAQRLARRYRALARAAVAELLRNGPPDTRQSLERIVCMDQRLARLDAQAGFGRRKGRKP